MYSENSNHFLSQKTFKIILYNFLTNSREYFNYIPYFCQMLSEILLLYIFSSGVYSAKFNIQLFHILFDHFYTEMRYSPLSCAVSKDDDSVCFNFPKVPPASGWFCVDGVSSVATICVKRKERSKTEMSKCMKRQINVKIAIFSLLKLQVIEKCDEICSKLRVMWRWWCRYVYMNI